MKKFLLFLLMLALLSVGVLAINNETDFFLNIGEYIPALEESFPELSGKISALSQSVSDMTGSVGSLKAEIESITEKTMPIDPEDIATNAYIKDSPMLSFYPKENISMQMNEDNTLSVFGITEDTNKANLIVCFDTPDGENLSQELMYTNSENQFSETFSVPETDYDTLSVSVYTGSRRYGDFISWVYNYVTISRDYYGQWSIDISPVYDSNVALYEENKSISDALTSTSAIQSDYENMRSLAEQVTADCQTDYDRAAAIHDWVASYLYYDSDSVSSEEVAPYSAAEVVNSRRAVCLGYATLYATLCRALNIPCNVVSGYALGIGSGETEWNDENIFTDEQNHAWNEVYLDGRWVIVDTTWDSQNRYENGEFTDGEVTHLYFDANLQYFSANHKILEYTLWR